MDKRDDLHIICLKWLFYVLPCAYQRGKQCIAKDDCHPGQESILNYLLNLLFGSGTLSMGYNLTG